MRLPQTVAFVSALLLSASSVACSANSGTGATLELPKIDASSDDTIPEDVPEETLREPFDENETRRLINRASEIHSLCSAWDTLDSLEEPDPRDVDELLYFSILYYDTLRQIDKTRKVQERVPAERGRPARVKSVPLTAEAKRGIDELRKHAYEYRVRVATWKTYFDQDVMSEEEMFARLNKAFMLFASEQVTRVHQRLAAYEQEHCDL